MSSLLAYLEQLWSWIVDLVVWLPLKLWEMLSDALASVIEGIPVPAWLAGADPFSAIDPGIVYFTDPLLLPEGISIVIGATLIRFLIRRLPVVG